MNRISLSGLRAIEAAARLGTLNAAADELGVTAGALSQRIARTEAQLGQPVFDRSGQSLRPTELGRDIAARLTRGMSELSAAVALADPTADTTLTISVAPLFASRWLVWRLPRFSQAHPAFVSASNRQAAW
ncbi:LysR family transcriptional regulator [Paracoccus tegillarcae]|uniref:LysR family transcriptional regulator n=1 Tax=Paracoccus tegillarcae TaxID=1529068 RepID=UPI00130096E5|nr:LysR family transcriptional regulator [Paracoccus tegillarcae]